MTSRDIFCKRARRKLLLLSISAIPTGPLDQNVSEIAHLNLILHPIEWIAFTVAVGRVNREAVYRTLED